MSFVETLESVLEHRAIPNVTTISPHFVHKILSEEEKQKLREKHLDDCRKRNDEAKNKHKVQRDGKGATVQRFPLKIDASKSLYQPPDVVSTGQVKNIVQVYPEKKGPNRGHWAAVKVCNSCDRKFPLECDVCSRCHRRLSQRPVYKDGKRLWIEGQHNYNRQLDPRNPDEAVLGTRLMNQNFELKKCVDPVTKQPISEIDENARIVTIGQQRRVYDRASQTEIIDDALKAAAEILRKKNFSSADKAVTSTSYQNSAQAGEHPESHK